MDATIQAMLDYLETGELRPELGAASALLGQAEMRHACVQILAWLKSDLFVPRRKKIHLPHHPWSFHALAGLVHASEELAQLFEIDNYSLGFQQSVPFEEQIRIHELVRDRYRPTVFR